MDNVSEKSYPVTIVVPIYNVENYIARCATSLFEQDFDDIEYLFIDDASSDNSIVILKEVIKRYPQRAEHVKIIHNAENLGLFETRKIGVMAATGEYIQHIDSDDWVESAMISKLYHVAKSKSADVVACDFYIDTRSEVRLYQQSLPEPRDELLTALFATQIKANIWSHFVKRDLYCLLYTELNLSNHQNMGEDKLVIMPLYCLMQNIYYLPRAFYHYEKTNMASLTATNTHQSYENAKFLCIFLSDFLQPYITEEQLNLFKYAMFLRLLFYCDVLKIRPDVAWFRKNGFGLRRLWSQRQVAFSLKLRYSLHFVNLSWVAVIIRYFINAYRIIKVKIIR